MNELMNYLQASPPLALALALNVVAEALKRTPLPNWWIPILLPAIGAIAYPYIAEVGKLSYEVAKPNVLLALYGVLIGSGAVGFNQAVRQFVGRKSTDEAQPTEQTKT